jgi:hypothetical protein
MVSPFVHNVVEYNSIIVNFSHRLSFKNWSLSLSDGELLHVRGRDVSRGEDGAVSGFTEWESGLALKSEDSFFFLWRNLVEKLKIKNINFYEQLHFECSASVSNDSLAISGKSLPTIVLCHGFCPESGPNYPLICVLSLLLRSCGFVVAVPDFRERYMTYIEHKFKLCCRDLLTFFSHHCALLV